MGTRNRIIIHANVEDGSFLSRKMIKHDMIKLMIKSHESALEAYKTMESII